MHATVTRPYSHSSADSQAKYRPKHELEDEAWYDPIAVIERSLLEARVLSPEDLDAVREQARALVAQATKAALAAPRPDPATIKHHLLDLPSVSEAESTERDEPAQPAGPALPRGPRLRTAPVSEVPSPSAKRCGWPCTRQWRKTRECSVFGEDVADAPPGAH